MMPMASSLSIAARAPATICWGNAVLGVNGKTVAERRVPRTAPTIFYYYETFDLGEDVGSTVDDYPGPFRFRGTIKTVTVEVLKDDKKPAVR